MTALLGLDPMMKDSAFRGKQRISKHGGQQIRNLLYLPTLCAIQHNSRIKKFYEGLTARAQETSCHRVILMAFKKQGSISAFIGYYLEELIYSA